MLDFPGEEICALIPPCSSFGYRARSVVMKALFRKLPRPGMNKIIMIVFLMFPLSFCLPAMAEEISPELSFLQGDYLSALEGYEKVSEKSDLVQYRIGICYLKLGNYEKAEEELRGVSSYSESTLLDDAQFAMGEALYLAGNFAEAVNLYQQLIVQYPQSPILHLVYFKLAMSHLKKKEEKEALEYFKKVRRLYPLSFEAVKANKIICQKEGQFSIQFGAFIDLDRAKSLLGNFQKKGYSSYLLKKVDDKPWIYKVRIGNFESSAKAILFTQQLPENTKFFITDK